MSAVELVRLPSPPPQWSDSQAQTLQDTWLLTLFAVLLGTALPWFVSGFAIDFAAASWALLALGAIYAALTALSNAQVPRATLRRRTLSLLHAAGVVAIGFLWQRCGGLQNPAFLLAFVLPVIGAHALSRWQPYVTAALAMLVVAAVALSQAPELRWYAGDLPVAGRWLAQLFGSATPPADTNSVFAGFYAPVGYDIVLLEVFAILLLACATVAETLGDAFEHVLEHLRSARAEAARSQELWSGLLQQLPAPALLVDVESLQVVLASRHLAPFWGDDTDLRGQGLLDCVRVSYPEQLREMVIGTGGAATAVIIHCSDELRVATIRVQHITRERLALVLLLDTTDAFQLSAALDAEEHATLVINARGRIVATNKAARALFADAGIGSDAGRVLSRSSGVQRWWEPGLMGRRRMHVTLFQRIFLTTCTAVPLPGEEEALFVVAFTPLLSAAATSAAMAAGAAADSAVSVNALSASAGSVPR